LTSVGKVTFRLSVPQKNSIILAEAVGRSVPLITGKARYTSTQIADPCLAFRYLGDFMGKMSASL
jgi:hypothetical protein